MQEKTISIVAGLGEVGEESGMFPRVSAVVAKTSEVSLQLLSQNLSEIVTSLGEVVAELPEIPGGFAVDALTFSLSIDATGKVSLLAEISSGYSSAVTVSIKRTKEAPEGVASLPTKGGDNDLS